MNYKQVTIGYVVAAWNAMGQPPLTKRERDEVTAIRNTALIADESMQSMPIHIGEPLHQFIESKSWNNPQAQAPQQFPETNLFGETQTVEFGKPQLSLVTLDD